MPNIRPVSDLKDYDRVLSEISADDPVFLTQNGRGRYVILDIYQYEKQCATLKLLSQLEKADEDIAEGRVYSSQEVERLLGLE